MKNIRDFYQKIFSFLEVKFSIYLNRRVVVMPVWLKETGYACDPICFTTRQAPSEKNSSLDPVSILYKSIAGRYRPVSYPDGPITARYRSM